MLMQLSYDRLMNIILKIDPLFIDSFLYFLSVSDPIFNTIGAEQQLRSALIMEGLGACVQILFLQLIQDSVLLENQIFNGFIKQSK